MAIMSSVKLAAQIRSIKSNAKNMREQIQEALISCAYHAAKDGQVTPFNNLLEAVGSATRIKGLTLWAETFGFVRVKNEKFVVNSAMRKEANVTNETDFAVYEAAMREAPMWFDMVEKEKTVSVFDASNYLNNVLKKLEKEHVGELVPYLERAIEEYNKAQAIKELMELEVVSEEEPF